MLEVHASWLLLILNRLYVMTLRLAYIMDLSSIFFLNHGFVSQKQY